MKSDANVNNPVGSKTEIIPNALDAQSTAETEPEQLSMVPTRPNISRESAIVSNVYSPALSLSPL